MNLFKRLRLILYAIQLPHEGLDEWLEDAHDIDEFYKICRSYHPKPIVAPKTIEVIVRESRIREPFQIEIDE